MITFYLTIVLERFILYMNIPMRKFKMLSNFAYSGILQVHNIFYNESHILICYENFSKILIFLVNNDIGHLLEPS